MDKHRILLVDDELLIGTTVANYLAGANYELEQVTSGGDAVRRLLEGNLPDLVLLDINLPDANGMDLLREMKDIAGDLTIVMITGYGNVETAVRAIKMGAADFVQKPFNRDFRKFIDELMKAKKYGAVDHSGIVGSSPQIKKVLSLVDRFALSDIAILLQGESGTGKELFARAIHRKSKRREGPFVPLDCAALSETLMESELFGHEKGAFTGASERKIGKFERAHGGTLFIDEIQNLSSSSQAKLLRAVEEKHIERVGGAKPVRVDVRIVSASNIPIAAIMSKGAFRSDLFYRFSQMTIDIPSLRERENDVELLTRHFLANHSRELGKEIRISAEALGHLNTYLWPGNVRELANVVKSAAILADREIETKHLPEYIRMGALPLRAETDEAGFLWLKVNEEIDRGFREGALDLKVLVRKWSDRIEETVIRNVVEKSDMNLTEVARFLDIDPKTLRAKLSKIGSDDKKNMENGNRFPEKGGDSLSQPC